MASLEPSSIIVIVNATSGEGWTQDTLAQLEEKFLREGLRAKVLAARDGSQLRSMAEDAARENPRALVAGGGDGTISTVASVVQSTDIALGVLPLGTLNHFAKDLSIPLDLDEAVKVIAAMRTVQVDMGQVNDRHFINNSSLGIYPDMVRDRQRQQRRLGRGKRWAMVWASLTALRRSPFLRLRLALDGERRDYRVPFVFVGNNEYVMEGFAIGQRDAMQDGKLSIYVTQRQSRIGLVTLGFLALFGRLRQTRDFHAITAESVEIETHRRHLHVATDGEVTLMQTPLHYRTLPGVLKVIVP